MGSSIPGESILFYEASLSKSNDILSTFPETDGKLVVGLKKDSSSLGVLSGELT